MTDGALLPAYRQDASAARGDAAPGLPLAPWRPRDLSGAPQDPRIRGRSDLFGAKKNQTHHLPPSSPPPYTRPRAPHPAPNPHKQTTPQKPHTRAARAHKPQGPQTRAGARTHAHGRKKQKKNSAIGTRTRVSWVKAKYDNHRGSETYGFSDLHLCPLSFQEGIAEFLRRSTDVCELRTADFSESWVCEQAIGETRDSGFDPLASGQIALRWRIRESSRARTGRRATSNPSCRNRAVASSHGSARIV